MEPKYKRILLKISGEALAGEQKVGINNDTITTIAKEVADVKKMGVEIAVVVGGGNFWRGRTGQNIDRATADAMGMLATVMNALALEDIFEKVGLKTAVQTPISMDRLAEPLNRKKAIEHLKDGRVVIFAAGTGSPFFSTDTAAALRAVEIDADVILLAKKVDAVYSDDPDKNPDAIKYEELSFDKVFEDKLGVMDATATTLCMENDLAIHVFAVAEEGNIKKAVSGEKIGTIIK